MENTTLNRILDILTLFCEQHGQVHDFGFGEVSAISEISQKYPLVWCDVQPSTIAEKTLQLNLVLFALDVVKDNAINDRDTLSDTLSIIQDIYAMFSNPDYEDLFLLEYSSSIDPAREVFADKVNGWKMTLILNLQQTRDRCQIPLK